MAIEPPPGGISAVDVDDDENVDDPSSATAFSASMKRIGINSRGAKMNEIDFTLAPSDVSLSRCYQMSGAAAAAAAAASSSSVAGSTLPMAMNERQRVQTLSLTRALNTASNRAVRRILLARSWPSAEALNLSLRTVLMQQQQQQQQQKKKKPTQQEDNTNSIENSNENDAKCPVPRPILNILMQRRGGTDNSKSNAKSIIPEPRSNNSNNNNESSSSSSSSGSIDEKWIANQIAVFRESYQTIPGYDMAEAYLDCILNLATSGVESPRVTEVMSGGPYEESYKRILSVIQSVGAVLEDLPDTSDSPPRKRIASKLLDQDICLSMLDKIAIANEKKNSQNNRNGAAPNDVVTGSVNGESRLTSVPYDAAIKLAYHQSSDKSMSFAEYKEKYLSETIAMVTAKKKSREEGIQPTVEIEKKPQISREKESKGAYDRARQRRLRFWNKDENRNGKSARRPPPAMEPVDTDTIDNTTHTTTTIEETSVKPDDLGGVLLSAKEPTMTRQLNVLSNIVQRTLIFGGDQELLVLAETLNADKPAFVQRWYPDHNLDDATPETRPGVQYLNALIQLLRDAYAQGVLGDINPPLTLTTGYRNAYERLTASLIELGSGYVRPSSSSSSSSSTLLVPPQSARQELGRLARWESAVRNQAPTNPYPEDMVGMWEVEDVVGGTPIGRSVVTLNGGGEVSVETPMQGLRWRLDPGPTHLDTCTFQVLSDDGAILQYKGFVDRGSRLEARFSKRSVRMRGSVSFLMRDVESSEDYWDDMLPMNYKNGMTKFIMTKLNGEI